jgi:hypothetical protein
VERTKNDERGTMSGGQGREAGEREGLVYLVRAGKSETCGTSGSSEKGGIMRVAKREG